MNMRLVSRTAVVLVVLYLPPLKQLAISIHDQISASLGAFLIGTAYVCSSFAMGISEEDVAGMMKECVFHVDLPGTCTNRTLG